MKIRDASDPLAASYEACRVINRRHGQTYYWSTAVLAAEQRPHVHALYAFCRFADDIVDDLGDAPVESRAAALRAYGERFRADLAQGHSDHPILAAVVDTVQRFDLAPSCFDRFLRSMMMDLTITQYATFAELAHYMDGSAAVIGEMMVPVLGATNPRALEPARALGVAFQLTNFLRDVGEDLDRGRVYLPQDDLMHFGADPWSRIVTREWIELMRYEIDVTREIYVHADEGLAYLPERSARCIAAARRLYSGILDQIERQGYDVFTRRASVSTARKLAVAGRAAIGRPLASRATRAPAGDRDDARLATGTRKP